MCCPLVTYFAEVDEEPSAAELPPASPPPPALAAGVDASGEPPVSVSLPDAVRASYAVAAAPQPGDPWSEPPRGEFLATKSACPSGPQVLGAR